MTELNDMLVDEVDTLMVTDRIFKKAYDYFSLCNTIILIYSLSKVFTIPYFLFHTTLAHLKAWFACVLIISAAQAYNYLQIKRLASRSDLYYRLATKFGHAATVSKNQLPLEVRDFQIRTLDTYDFTNLQQDSEDQRRMKMLSVELKYQIQQIDRTIFYLGRIHFGVYQLLHIWGLIIIFTATIPEQSVKTYLIIILFLSTYQYIQFYLLILFMALMIPIYFLRKTFFLVRHKIRAYKIARAMRSQFFNNQNIKGDSQCRICLQPYELNQKIVTLRCSDLHNFHSSCLNDWVKNSQTCPLCRKELSSM